MGCVVGQTSRMQTHSRSTWVTLHQNQANHGVIHLRTFPVVQVVVQHAVTRAKLQGFERFCVVHHVQTVEDILVLLILKQR
jgi:hypothetical protein